jgi:trans-aconitate 2-methyltransferase
LKCSHYCIFFFTIYWNVLVFPQRSNSDPLSSFGIDRWYPEEYVKYVRSYEAWAVQRLNSYRFLGSEKILDYGCMDGRITALMAGKVAQGSVIGFDTSASMIHYASVKYADQKNLQFLQGDEELLECGSGFNLITCFFMIQWVKDISLKIKQFQKCLAPEGMLWIVTTYGMPDASGTALKRVLMLPRWRSYFEGYKLPMSFYSEDDYRRLLREANLQLLDLQIFKGRELFVSRESFFSYLEQLFPPMDLLPAELKGECLNDFIDFYLELVPPDRYGRIILMRNIIEVKARNI